LPSQFGLRAESAVDDFGQFLRLVSTENDVHPRGHVTHQGVLAPTFEVLVHGDGSPDGGAQAVGCVMRIGHAGSVPGKLGSSDVASEDSSRYSRGMTLLYTLTITDLDTDEEWTAVSETIGPLIRWESVQRWEKVQEAKKAASMARHPSNIGTVVSAGTLWASGQET
jgi:hypothetical protein